MALDIVDVLVDVLATAIELRRVDLDHEGFAALLGQGHAGRKRHPVVRVDQIEMLGQSQGQDLSGITSHLRIDVRAIIALTAGFEVVVQKAGPIVLFAERGPRRKLGRRGVRSQNGRDRAKLHVLKRESGGALPVESRDQAAGHTHRLGLREHEDDGHAQAIHRAGQSQTCCA